MERDEIEALIARTPFTGYLGHRLVDAADGRASVELRTRPEHVQEAGAVHGGVLTSLADSTCVYALLSTGRWEPRFTGVELKLNFLRPPKLSGAPLIASADVVQQGRRIGVCDVQIAQGERLIAKGLFTFLVIDERP